jgi:DNA-binding LytR/AlgR family response regulator
VEFKLIIDKEKPQEIVATVHERSALIDKIETLIMEYSGADKIPAFSEDEIINLDINEIECITVMDSKTYAIYNDAKHYRLKQRLFEIEKNLPTSFIKINKSSIANETKIDRFKANFSGAVDAIFKCGYKDYVSRRCFAEIKRRYK